MKGTGEKLGAKEGEVGGYREGLGFGVKMSDGGYLHVTHGYAEGEVLDCLESKYGGRGSAREPDGSSVCD